MASSDGQTDPANHSDALHREVSEAPNMSAYAEDYKWYNPVSIAGTKLVLQKHRSAATCLWWNLHGCILVYVLAQIALIAYKPKVITVGIEGSDQFGRMPNLLVCHDSQISVNWNKADLFVRHFDPHARFNASLNDDFTVRVSPYLQEPPGQVGGSCLNISSRLTPFRPATSAMERIQKMWDKETWRGTATTTTTSTTVTTTHPANWIQPDPLAWYIFDFQTEHINKDNRPRRFGVPEVLYLIAEDDSGHRSMIGTVALPKDDTNDTQQSTMIELQKIKRLKDADLSMFGVEQNSYYEYHGVEHKWRMLDDSVVAPKYDPDCSATKTIHNPDQHTTEFSAKQFCLSTQQSATKDRNTTNNLNTVVVVLMMAKHDVNVRHRFSKLSQSLTALGAAGGFSGLITLIYSIFVGKRFRASHHEVLRWKKKGGFGVCWGIKVPRGIAFNICDQIATCFCFCCHKASATRESSLTEALLLEGKELEKSGIDLENMKAELDELRKKLDKFESTKE